MASRFVQEREARNRRGRTLAARVIVLCGLIGAALLGLRAIEVRRAEHGHADRLVPILATTPITRLRLGRGYRQWEIETPTGAVRSVAQPHPGDTFAVVDERAYRVGARRWLVSAGTALLLVLLAVGAGLELVRLRRAEHPLGRPAPP